MNRAGLTSFGVPGCNADVLEIFQKWKAQDRLNVRIFCIGGAAAGNPGAGGPLHPADRPDEAVPGRQLHRQRVLRRKRVLAAARPDVRAEVRIRRPISSRSGAAWRWRSRRPACRCTCTRSCTTRSTRSSIRSRRSTRNIRSRTCAGRWRTSTRSTRRSSSA